MTMKISEKGLALISQFEGLSLNSYYCQAGKLTIGYGHTGSDVAVGQHITAEKAMELLKKDVSSAELTVSDLVNRALSQNQFDALVSFVFNIGRGNFSRSTMRAKLNDSSPTDVIAEQFEKWIYVNGKISKGLVRRRAAEKALFLLQ